MKKYLVIALFFIVFSAQSQSFDPYSRGWRYTPRTQTDSLQVLKYFKINGEQIQIISATDGQTFRRVDGIWTNVDPWTLAFDSVRFSKTDGLLKFYSSGIVAISDTLDGRYPLKQEMVDSINSIAMTKAVYDTLRLGGQIVNTDSLQTLKKKILITPTIASFKNAMHDHSDSINGGLLSDIYRNVFGITLPSSTTVTGRCSGAVSGTDYPSTWTINADGVSPYNLVIHHGMHRYIASVTVFTVSGNVQRQLFANAAYSGIICSNDSTLTIESLATIQSKIAINLIFK